MRKYGYQDSQLRNILDRYRDTDNNKPRFTFNLPDCSLVETNQTNHLDTNQMSWLDKFTESNEKQNSTDLFKPLNPDEQQEPKNQMKFSFNQNYAFPPSEEHREIPTHNQRAGKIKQVRAVSQYIHSSSTKIIPLTQSSNILNDILNTEGSIKQRPKKQHSVGSIKRNKACYNTANQKDKHQKNQTIQKISNYSTEQSKNISNKLLKLQKQNYQTSQIKFRTDQKPQQFVCNSREPNKKLPIYRQSFLNLNQAVINPKPQQNSVQSNLTLNTNTHLQNLFDRLDKTKTGKLTKDNCSIQNIPEQFKFIFGNIFTRIKLKNLICNKKQFVKLCKNAIKEIDSQEVIKLLKQLQTQEPSLSFLKDLELDNRNSQSCYLIVDNNKSKNSLSKNANILHQEHSGSNLFQKPPRKFSCYEPIVSQSYEKSFHQRKYQNELKFPKQQTTKIENSRQSKLAVSKISSLENSSYSNPKNATSTIKDHQKGLDSLMKLNSRISTYLNTKLLSEHSAAGSIRDDNLKFDELVKHI